MKRKTQRHMTSLLQEITGRLNYIPYDIIMAGSALIGVSLSGMLKKGMHKDLLLADLETIVDIIKEYLEEDEEDGKIV